MHWARNSQLKSALSPKKLLSVPTSIQDQPKEILILKLPNAQVSCRDKTMGSHTKV